MYAAVAKQRNLNPDLMADLVGGLDQDGVLHWAPLRDSLTNAEAHDLIDRLTGLEQSVTP
jgi:hypothetical protein